MCAIVSKIDGVKKSPIRKNGNENFSKEYKNEFAVFRLELTM